MPNLAWGFHRLEDIASERVTDNITRVRDAVNEYIAAQNQLTTEMLSTFAELTTESQAKFKLPGTMELQPLTQLSRPRVERYAETEYTMAWPVRKAGLALGQTYEQRVVMDINNFAGLVDAVGVADQRWLFRQSLAALFYNGAGWTHDDPDDTEGALTIKGLANGDSQVYLTLSGATATDDHYKAQAADLLSASDPIPGIKDDLEEHPMNTGDTIILGATADRLKYTGLAAFYPERDPRLQAGSNITEFVGGAPANVPGEFIGYHDSGAFIFLWRAIPANYMVGYTAGGPKALRHRERSEPALRGFQLDDERADYPFYEQPYVRRGGFGGWNRVGAVVQRFGNAAYAIPTGYSAPLP